MAKFSFKKGDTVEIIAGDDKGTKATVLSVMPKKNKVIVEGCKIAKKAILNFNIFFIVLSVFISKMGY